MGRNKKQFKNAQMSIRTVMEKLWKMYERIINVSFKFTAQGLKLETFVCKNIIGEIKPWALVKN